VCHSHGGHNLKKTTMQAQFLIIGRNDRDAEIPLALLTRTVFESREDAERYCADPVRAFRAPQIVECPFPIANIRPTTNPQS
jgi:hypothetical protein